MFICEMFTSSDDADTVIGPVRGGPISSGLAILKFTMVCVPAFY